MSPNGRSIVAAADDELTTWDIGDDGIVADEPTAVVAHDATITALGASECGFLSTGDEDGVAHIWSPLLAAQPVATVRLDSEITALAWSRDGNRLALGAVSGELVVADVRAGLVA